MFRLFKREPKTQYRLRWQYRDVAYLRRAIDVMRDDHGFCDKVFEDRKKGQAFYDKLNRDNELEPERYPRVVYYLETIEPAAQH